MFGNGHEMFFTKNTFKSTLANGDGFTKANIFALEL
jgi:hypothetical protein